MLILGYVLCCLLCKCVEEVFNIKNLDIIYFSWWIEFGYKGIYDYYNNK